MKLPNLNKYKIKSKLKKIIFLKNYILTCVLIIGFSNFAHAIFRTRILNTDTQILLNGTYKGTPCGELYSFDTKASIKGSPNDNLAPCFPEITLATYADVEGVFYIATSLGETITKLRDEQKTKDSVIENTISNNALTLSSQLEKVIKELVTDPHLIGNNTQTSNNRQALEALITAVVKKQLKESVKLNCQNTVGE